MAVPRSAMALRVRAYAPPEKSSMKTRRNEKKMWSGEGRNPMSIACGTFETLSPSRFISFSFPNPASPLPNSYADPLRIAVLDSPLLAQATDPNPQIAALLVPQGREHDWLFSTKYGHLQLLLANSPDPISRLILVGNPPLADPPPNAAYARPTPADDACGEELFQQRLLPILLALSPKLAFKNGIPKIPFVAYEDNVLCSVSVFRCNGPVVGEMLVEDVEIEVDGRRVTGSDVFPAREFQRRLRFKRMPNLIQTVTRIVPDATTGTKPDTEGFGIEEAEFRPETSVLVQPYLPPMVAGLSLIAPCLEERVRAGKRPRMLCVGVGGGSLIAFLRTHIGFFHLLGVEMDEAVLEVARRYFGLVEDEYTRVCSGNGIEMIRNLGWLAIQRNTACHELARDQGVDFCGNQENVGDMVKLMCNSASGGLDVGLWHRWACDFDGGEIENGENRQCRCWGNLGCGMESRDDFHTTSGMVSDDFRRWEVGNGELGQSGTVRSFENCNGNSNLVSKDFCKRGTGKVEILQEVDNACGANCLVDVIMVDLDSGDARTGLSAPPPEFIQKPIILASRFALHEHGILVMNVIVVDESSYIDLIRLFREVFSELYEIDVGNGENYVLIATASPINIEGNGCGRIVLEKLKRVIDGKYVDCIRKI